MDKEINSPGPETPTQNSLNIAPIPVSRNPLRLLIPIILVVIAVTVASLFLSGIIKFSQLSSAGPLPVSAGFSPFIPEYAYCGVQNILAGVVISPSPPVNESNPNIGPVSIIYVKNPTTNPIKITALYLDKGSYNVGVEISAINETNITKQNADTYLNSPLMVNFQVLSQASNNVIAPNTTAAIYSLPLTCFGSTYREIFTVNFTSTSSNITNTSSTTGTVGGSVGILYKI